jgi:HK97 family phage major capsid protein
LATEFANGLYQDGGAHLNAGVEGVFIPELWSAQLLTDTEDQLVLGSLFATNTYEGEFRREGDVIRIPHFRDTVSDKGRVAAYGSIGTADRAELDYIKMQVNKGSSFHLELDNLHQMQTKQGIDLMSELVRQRARKTAIALDTLVANTLITASQETAANSGLGKDLNSDSGTEPLHGLVESVALGTGTQARYNQVVDMLALLDDANADGERFLVIGTSVKAEILKLKEFIDASHWGGSPIMVNGFIGSLLGVPVIVTNTIGPRIARKGKQSLLSGSHDAARGVDMLLGTRGCVAAVIPNIDMKVYEPEAKFTQAVKSRIHYDSKVIVPHGVVVGLPADTTP